MYYFCVMVRIYRRLFVSKIKYFSSIFNKALDCRMANKQLGETQVVLVKHEYMFPWNILFVFLYITEKHGMK